MFNLKDKTLCSIISASPVGMILSDPKAKVCFCNNITDVIRQAEYASFDEEG